jgi:Fe-S cluster assembly scaffold protein SufB
MYPTSSIVHARDVRMHGDNAGGSKNFPMTRITKPTNMPLNSAGVKRTQTTGSATEHLTPNTISAIESCSVFATKSAVSMRQHGLQRGTRHRIK